MSAYLFCDVTLWPILNCFCSRVHGCMQSISARGAAVLSDVLSQSCSLQKLSLARNPLTDEGEHTRRSTDTCITTERMLALASSFNT